MTGDERGGRSPSANARDRTTANLILLYAATFVSALSAFLVHALLANAFGPEEYGALATALAMISLAAPFAGFGVGKYWLRVFGLEGWGAKRWLFNSLLAVACCTAIALGTIAVWSTFAGVGPSIRTVTLLLLPTLLVYPATELASARLQLEERYVALGLWQATPNVFRLLVAIAAVTIGASVQMTAIGFSAALSIVTVAMGLLIARMAAGDLRLVGHGARPDARSHTPASLRSVVTEAWPFATAGVFYLIYFQSDVLLLGWIRGAEAAGVYNVAFTIMAAVFLLPSVAHQKYLLPKMHRWAVYDRERFLRMYQLGNGVSLAAGVLVAVALFASATWIVPLIFGEAYRSAASALLILSLSIPGRYLATSVGSVLVTEDNMRRKVWFMGITALVNIAANLVLIPTYGIYGAAFSTVISELVLLVAYLYAAHRFVFGRDAFRGWTLIPKTRSES